MVLLLLGNALSEQDQFIDDHCCLLVVDQSKYGVFAVMQQVKDLLNEDLHGLVLNHAFAVQEGIFNHLTEIRKLTYLTLRVDTSLEDFPIGTYLFLIELSKVLEQVLSCPV